MSQNKRTIEFREELKRLVEKHRVGLLIAIFVVPDDDAPTCDVTALLSGEGPTADVSTLLMEESTKIISNGIERIERILNTNPNSN